MSIFGSTFMATRGMGKTTLQMQRVWAEFIHSTYGISLEESYKLVAEGLCPYLCDEMEEE